MTAAPLDHIHISEREPDGSWEDCTWDSGLEWYRLCYDASKPATHTEAQALRKASGEPATGGSNLGDLAKGIKARYSKVIPARITGYLALKAALRVNHAAVIQGSMSAFGPNHRLSKYDRNFDGAHAVHLINFNGVLLWCDPEAPKDAAVPVVVSWAEVKAFVAAFAGQHVVAPIKRLAAPPVAEDTMPVITSYTPGDIAVFKTGSNIRSTPDTTKPPVRQAQAGEKFAIIGKVKGAEANGSTDWVAFAIKGVVVYNHVSNVVSITKPATGYSQAQLDAAVAKQAVSDKAVQDAAVKASVAAATEAEKARVRAVLGI